MLGPRAAQSLAYIRSKIVHSGSDGSCRLSSSLQFVCSTNYVSKILDSKESLRRCCAPEEERHVTPASGAVAFTRRVNAPLVQQLQRLRVNAGTLAHEQCKHEGKKR